MYDEPKGFGFSIDDGIAPDIMCTKCKWDFRKFQETGRFGCENCYQVFSTVLAETLRNIHKGVSHIGKSPNMKSSGPSLIMLEILNLQKQLDIHIRREEFEEAAKLRDQINGLKKKWVLKKMKNSSIDKLLSHPVSWLENTDNDEDIALSSRIRLARNLSGIIFPSNASETERRQVYSVVSTSIKNNKIIDKSIEFNIDSLSDIDRQFLLERHLISYDFCKGGAGSSLIINGAESCGVMINEEDHIRLQVMQPGLSLRKIWTVIDDIDNNLSRYIPFAYSKTLGYLTSCPTNVGTGMRASVMLNLPGLILGGHLNAVTQGVNKLGLAVRGLFGEGSGSMGHLYQVSNQSTLGETEPQIVKRLENIIRQIINHEKNARLKLLEKQQSFWRII